MAEDSFATRREFDMLVSRVESIDSNGTRGFVGIQAQLTDAIKDIMEVKIDMASFKKDTSEWFAHHVRQHDDDVKARAIERKEDRERSDAERREVRESASRNRRWLLMFFVTLLIALGGLYPIIINHIH